MAPGPAGRGGSLTPGKTSGKPGCAGGLGALWPALRCRWSGFPWQEGGRGPSPPLRPAEPPSRTAWGPLLSPGYRGEGPVSTTPAALRGHTQRIELHDILPRAQWGRLGTLPLMKRDQSLGGPGRPTPRWKWRWALTCPGPPSPPRLPPNSRLWRSAACAPGSPLHRGLLQPPRLLHLSDPSLVDPWPLGPPRFPGMEQTPGAAGLQPSGHASCLCLAVHPVSPEGVLRWEPADFLSEKQERSAEGQGCTAVCELWRRAGWSQT